MGEEALLHQSRPPIALNLQGSRVLYWPSIESEQPPNATLVFIVGNPGLADYYITYLNELQRLVYSDGRSSLEIFCISQLGHDPNAISQPSKLISLEDQLLNKADIVRSIVERWASSSRSTSPKLLLAGHSIGAYMALELVRRRLIPQSVLAVHLLFPALHQIGQSPNARKLSWLLRASDRPATVAWTNYLPTALMLVTLVVNVILRIVQFLPLPIIHFLVLIGAPTQPLDAIRITTNFILQPQCVQQALNMGRDEMRLVQKVHALAEEEHKEAVDSRKQVKTGARSADGSSNKATNGIARDVPPVKLRAYWASGDLDGWAPQSTRLAVEETLGMKGYELPADIIDKQRPTHGRSLSNGTTKKRRAFSIDEIRKARRAGKRRALAGMVRAGASAGYGLASSLGNLGYGQRRGGPPPAPSAGTRHIPTPLSSPVRTIRRRPSLVAARASRRFDGSIVIEPAPANGGVNGESGDDDSELDLLAKTPDGSADGIVFSPSAIEPTLEDVMAPGSTTARSTKTLAEEANVTLRMPDRASIVCKLGMPHAFVLEHSERMAAISSAMIIADIL